MFQKKHQTDSPSVPNIDSDNETIVNFAKKNMDESVKILKNSAWKLEKTTPDGDTAYSTVLPQLGKVYRMKGSVQCKAQILHDDLFNGVDKLSEWCSSVVLESKRIKQIDPNTDITYQVSTNALSGLVSSRDFICTRCQCQDDGTYMLSNISIGYPPTQYTRGDTKIAIICIKDNPEKEGWSDIEWANCMTLGGWLPVSVVNMFFISNMINYMTNLRKHAEQLREKAEK